MTATTATGEVNIGAERAEALSNWPRQLSGDNAAENVPRLSHREELRGFPHAPHIATGFALFCLFGPGQFQAGWAHAIHGQ